MKCQFPTTHKKKAESCVISFGRDIGRQRDGAGYSVTNFGRDVGRQRAGAGYSVNNFGRDVGRPSQLF